MRFDNSQPPYRYDINVHDPRNRVCARHKQTVIGSVERSGYTKTVARVMSGCGDQVSQHSGDRL